MEQKGHVRGPRPARDWPHHHKITYFNYYELFYIFTEITP